MSLKTQNSNKKAEHDCCSHDDPQPVSKHTHSNANHAHHDHDGHEHTHDDDEHEHSHDGEDQSLFTSRWPLWTSLSILLIFLATTWIFQIKIAKPVEIALMLTAYILAGYKTIGLAFRKVKRGDLFNEFTLMTIATLGAFYIGEFSEGVAVMIFYEIGELFQDLAVSRSKRSIKALLDIRPDQVTVIRNHENVNVLPDDVRIGETILAKAGEKVALDGILKSQSGTFNTAALTGESKPDVKRKDETVLAGMINTDKAVEIEVTSLFKDSKLSRILEMVQEATARKSPTQLLITKLAKIYTPIVFGLAMLIILIPWFFVQNYDFQEWLYRGMVFLVIACPCALTISIPLGYFGGIGLASRNGILVKGSNFLDAITKIDTVVMDKTGTLTKGVFNVQKVETVLDKNQFLRSAASLESYSTHPIAKAVVRFASNMDLVTPGEVEEIAGHGLKGIVDSKVVLAGNQKLLEKHTINYPSEIENIVETVVLVAIDGKYAGYITISDEPKEDAAETIVNLQKLGIETIMLSGDKSAVTSEVAKTLKIDQAYGDLLPEDKVRLVQDLKDKGKNIAFVGDGLNDAPVIALADVGFAMGGLGSDATIETADIVIQNDQPSKIVSAIKIGRITKSIVYQNIGLAMGIKVLVMVLGAGGIATLWEAVFADVGVALLAILNAFRIQGKRV
jgi:Cd2+/Zn2+-exporting ATPase